MRNRALANLSSYRSIALCLLLVSVAAAAPIQAHAQDGNGPAVARSGAVLWSDPGDIRARDLFYGPGGKEHLPQLPVKFEKEVPEGSNPKFDVVDGQGKKWRAKVGFEAQPETVAARLLWAVGFAANENYYFPDVVVTDLPPKLHRGQGFVHPGGHVSGVRLQKHAGGKDKGKREGTWAWKHNPFVGTREFNGLRVMMAVISNWDLTTQNTAIREDREGEEVYEVSDVGSSFGKTGRGWHDATSKNNPDGYSKAKFIAKVTPEYVDFSLPTRPPFLFIFDLKMYYEYASAHWIGRHIPRGDVKWVASLLSQLSAQQIRDAFRAAGYTPAQIDEYTAALQDRIAKLNQL